MNDNLRFHRPKLRGDVTIIETSDGARVSRLGGRRFVEFEFERERHAELCQFLMALADFGIPRQELSGAFPGSLEELEQLVEALDEQGMLDEGDERERRAVSAGSLPTDTYADTRMLCGDACIAPSMRR